MRNFPSQSVPEAFLVMHNPIDRRSNLPIAARAAHGAEFQAHRLSTTLVLVDVYGDLDMISTPVFGQFVESQLEPQRRLIIDLSALGFIGTAALGVLSDVGRIAPRLGTDWMLVTGRATSRLLHAAGLESRYPTATSVDLAVAALRAGRN